MNFSAWLTKVTDFVSLGNIMTNAGPGMLLALSLLVIGAQLFDLPLFIVAPRARIGEQKDAPAPVHPVIARHEKRVEEWEGQVAAAERMKADTDAQIADVQADIKALDASITSTEAQSVAFVRTEVLKRRREARRHDLAQLASAKAGQELQVQAKKRRLESAQKELDGVRASQNFTASQLLDNALSHLIGITFVGYILGTLLNPINRVLFFEWGDLVAGWREPKEEQS